MYALNFVDGALPVHMLCLNEFGMKRSGHGDRWNQYYKVAHLDACVDDPHAWGYPTNAHLQAAFREKHEAEAKRQAHTLPPPPAYYSTESHAATGPSSGATDMAQQTHYYPSDPPAPTGLPSGATDMAQQVLAFQQQSLMMGLMTGQADPMTVITESMRLEQTQKMMRAMSSGSLSPQEILQMQMQQAQQEQMMSMLGLGGTQQTSGRTTAKKKGQRNRKKPTKAQQKKKQQAALLASLLG